MQFILYSHYTQHLEMGNQQEELESGYNTPIL